MPSVRAGKIIVKRLGLDKGISSRMEIENAGARHSEHSIHPPEPSQQ
jgi:hypothetical protein